ncbi:MAG: hypothetical protein WCO09_03755, partial [bacterium]
MYILTVHPIQRSTFKETLTYWAPHNFNAGSIIYVPFRNKNILALVETCINATESKADIKNADFIARKIESKKTITAVSPSLIKACQSVSREYAYPIGAIIKTIIPECALLYAEEIINKKGKHPSEKDSDANIDANESKTESKEEAHSVSRKSSVEIENNDDNEDDGFTEQPSSRDIFVFQTNTTDRYGTYKSIIREEFAKKKSVVIIAPTVNSAEEIYEELSRGISDYAYLLHGGINKKKQVEIWGKALNESHTIALITTPSFVGLPREDIATIVVERESSRSYITMFKPLFDYRYLFQKWSKELKARLIYGDILLRVETLYKRERGEVFDFFPISMRIEKRPNTIIVDMSEPLRKEKAKKEKDKINSKNNLIYSEELESQVEYAGKKKEKMIIFTARRGLAPQTVCG